MNKSYQKVCVSVLIEDTGVFLKILSWFQKEKNIHGKTNIFSITQSKKKIGIIDAVGTCFEHYQFCYFDTTLNNQ